MVPEYRIISIGTLAAHPLWSERGEVRTGHATTTLIKAEDATILVNPSLPGQALNARLNERAGMTAEAVTHVFLTSFLRDHRRGLWSFDHARWLMHEPEREAAMAQTKQALDAIDEDDDPQLHKAMQQELEALERIVEAPQRLAPHVDLFPMPGMSVGTCGLLIALPTSTVLICGDAVPTVEHLDQGKVLQTAADVEQAQESFREALEIADVLVPGRDNVVVNPLRRKM